MKFIKFLSTSILIAFSFHMIQAQETPIIDREIFFGNTEYSQAKLSPNGKFISFIKPHLGVKNIWVKGRYDSFDSAYPITADTNRPIPGYFWSRDSKYILFVQDQDGDENYQVYAVDPSTKPAVDQEVPEARNITNVPGIRAFIMSVPKSNPDIMYVGMNDRDPAWHDLYEISISTGERKLILENDNQYTGFFFDLKDDLRLATATDGDGNTVVYKNNNGSFQECYRCDIFESCYPIKGSKEENKFYFASNKGDRDLVDFGLLDLSTNTFETIESDPKGKADFGGAFFSTKTDELVSTNYVGDKKQVYWKDEKFKKDYIVLKEEFPNSEISITSMTDNEALWIIYVNSDVDAGAAYLFRREDKNIEFLYKPRPDLPTEHLVEMQIVRYKSSDGLEIPAYLSIPKGKEAKNLPAMIVPHGGPWARDNWGFNSFAQFLANRGYAVLQPNFRGSTGFGKAFLNAGNNEWGQLMQDDLTAGAEYLIEQGIADKDKIGIMGGSYGGYATLAGLTFTPDVYKAGVSIVGPSNLFTLLETIPPYWASFLKVFHERMGDPSTEEGQAQLKRQSPFFHAQNIKAPLLVGQGNNDPRVKTAESDQIVVAMRDLGLPVEYLNFMDEGHGFANPENMMAFLSVTEKFLATHLGGRYQEEVREEIAAIVSTATVDISKVTLLEKITTEMASSELPAPVHSVKVSTDKYKMTIEMGAQKIPMDMTKTIEDGGDYWIVTDKASSPMGDVVDICHLSKSGLKPIKRKVSQGAVNMEMDITDSSVKGNVSMQGKDTPVDIGLDAPTFSDGAGLGVTLAALPLKKGYTTVYRVFDANSQKVKNYKLIVEDTEEMRVGEKLMDCFRTKVESLDGDGSSQMMWFSTSNNQKLVKLEANLPEMGGAKMTIQLEE